MNEKADEFFVNYGCLSPGDLLADLKQRSYTDLRARRQQNAEAAAVYQRLMDGPPEIDQAEAADACQMLRLLRMIGRLMDKPPVRTMPARALNRGPQKIGLFTL